MTASAMAGITRAATWRLARDVAVWEFRLLSRGAGFWLAAAVASAAAVIMAQSGITSPAVAGGELARWGLLVSPLLFLLTLGAARRRDEAAGIHELVHSRPVPALAYLAGKFAAGWAALTATWLFSLAAAAAALAAVEPAALVHWPATAAVSGLLGLPAFAFITALCLAADAAAGRSGLVFALGAAAVLGSFLYHPGLWISNLMPLFAPRNVSAVFGFAPWTGAVLANKGWTLALTAILLAVAVWLFSRRTPALRTAADEPVRWGLLGAGIAGALAAAVALSPVPMPGGWTGAARQWELAQVEAAVAGDPSAAAYWQWHAFPGDPWPVEVLLARGSERAAVSLARAAQAVLPYFPAIQPPPGQPFRLVQGSYLGNAVLVGGALVILNRDMTSAQHGQTQRAVVRAAAEAAWSQLAGVPAASQLYPWLDLSFSWGYAPALFQQWSVLAELAPPGSLDRELEAWRNLRGELLATGARPNADLLFASGAAGYSIAYDGVDRALALWDLGREVGREQVLAALQATAERVGPIPPGNDMVRWDEAEFDYWSAVSAELGRDVTQLAGWPERPPLGKRPGGPGPIVRDPSETMVVPKDPAGAPGAPADPPPGGR